MEWDEEIIFVLKTIYTKSENVTIIEPKGPLSPTKAIEAIYGIWYNKLYPILVEKKIKDYYKLLFFLEDNKLIRYTPKDAKDENKKYYQITDTGMQFLLQHENNQGVKKSIEWIIISIWISVWACFTSVILPKISCHRIAAEITMTAILVIVWNIIPNLMKRK